jgi:hypothetical protein
VDTLRAHWVPTIPGYGGYIPGKYAENICGGGTTHVCKMSSRAIAERDMLPAGREPITMKDYTQRSRVAEHYHTRNSQSTYHSEESVRHAQNVRDHCTLQIPGYQGHIPRVHGESICGASQNGVNRIAADFVDDRLFNPETHHTMCCKPQRPVQKKLRF